MAKGKSKYFVHPQYGHCYGEFLVTPPVRVVFPSLTKPKDPPPPKDGKAPGAPRYECPIIFDKKDPATKPFFEALKAMLDDMLPYYNEGKKAQIGNLVLFTEGDKFDLEKYPFYKDTVLITPRNAQLPTLVDANKNKIEPSAIVGGMKVKVVLTPMITASGASYKANIIQLVADDGVRFAGGVNSGKQAMALLDGGTTEEAPAKESQGVSGKMSQLDML